VLQVQTGRFGRHGDLGIGANACASETVATDRVVPSEETTSAGADSANWKRSGVRHVRRPDCLRAAKPKVSAAVVFGPVPQKKWFRFHVREGPATSRPTPRASCGIVTS
jgi:hypothetical protein